MAENMDRVRAVQRMQDYIAAHYTDKLNLEALAKAAAYSPWHALRAFTELTGRTPFGYIRAVRLSAAARRLRDTQDAILQIALDTGFDSHEGFLRAFARAYGLTPKQYRETAPPIQLFTPYRLHRFEDDIEKGDDLMTGHIIFAHTERRPARKLILKRGKQATEYFAYCEEVGCDVWGMLESINGALYESVGAWLPDALRTPGTSKYVQGVEVPADYAGQIPEGFDIIDLPACTYLVFQGEPFKEQDFSDAIGVLWNAVDRYRPETLGLAWAEDDGPRLQYAPMGERGYIEYRPVRPIPPVKSSLA